MPQPLTIHEAAQNYLHNLEHRNRRPARASSLATFSSHVRRVTPIIGHEPVETFGNKHLKNLMTALVADKLAPKTISDVTSTVKQIIGSVVDENGDQVYPRKWNTQFLDAPVVGLQKRPCATVDQIHAALKASEGSYKIFYALTAGTGLRIGEALALRIGDDGQHSAWGSKNSIVHVRDAFWRGQLGLPKTEAGVRSVELCRALNEFLIKSVDTRTGFLVASADGSHMKESTLRQSSMAKLGIPGAHSLRRFRITHLRRNKVAEELIDYFTGHKSTRNLNDIYSKLSADAEYRREVAETVGLGFSL
jgi:integrase